MSDYVLGIDAGTESIRAGIYDTRGRTIAFGTSENSTVHGKPGWAEQSLDQWDRSLRESILIAIRRSGISPSDIRGVGVDGTSCTVVCLDERRRPVRSAIMWMDIRAVREAGEIAASGDPALKYVGFGNVSAEWFPCKTLWLKRNEPEAYARASTIFEHTDWLVYRLTGEITANINTTTIRWFYDRREGGFPVSLYESVGLDDIFDKLPGRVLDIGVPAGGLSEEMAQATGLRAGIPVAVGGADAYMGVIGANALKPGQLALITGSSHLHIGLSDCEVHAAGLFGSFPDAIIPGYDVVEAGQISTGSVLKWFISHFLNDEIRSSAAEGSVYDVLNERASRIPPGSEGLLVMEHWQGNRTPWVDANSRGVIRGLTLRHGPVHIYRAIMEGVVYGTAVILRRMAENGFAVREIIASGGATQSELWLKLHADITGKPIAVPAQQQAACLGSAIAGTVAAGFFPTLNDAADAMVRIARVVEPDETVSALYSPYVDQYESTYHALKDLSAELVAISE